MESFDKAALLKAVEQYARERHSTLTRWSIILTDPDDKERLVDDSNGYLLFDVTDLTILEQDGKCYYVSAAIVFHVSKGEPIDTDPDTYECYQGDNNEWIIEWYSC